MEPVLVDTSIWIDYIRQRDTAQVRLLSKYLTLSDLSIYMTSVIVQEVLQGVHEDSLFSQVKRNLLSLAILKLDPVEAAIEAAQLYRSLRKKGVTIRKPNDCLIAHYAIFYDIPILHNDTDFDQIRPVYGLTNWKSISIADKLPVFICRKTAKFGPQTNDHT